MQARLSPENVRPGAPIGVVLTGQRDGFAGVFLWQADGTVSRAFPSEDRPYLEMKGRGRLCFLPKEDDAPVAARSPDGVAQDLGALVMVVSTAPVDFRELAGDDGSDGPVPGCPCRAGRGNRVGYASFPTSRGLPGTDCGVPGRTGIHHATSRWERPAPSIWPGLAPKGDTATA